jgi:hypothetical protein
MTTKRTGLAARNSSIQAAMAASGDQTSQTSGSNGSVKEASLAPSEGGKVVGLSVRLTPDLHDALRRISYEERKSIHTLLLEGVDHVIGTRKR